VAQNMSNATLQHILKNALMMNKISSTVKSRSIRKAKESGSGITIIAKTSTNCILEKDLHLGIEKQYHYQLVRKQHKSV